MLRKLYIFAYDEVLISVRGLEMEYEICPVRF
jgi:hypothetical protein